MIACLHLLQIIEDDWHRTSVENNLIVQTVGTEVYIARHKTWITFTRLPRVHEDKWNHMQ